MPRPRTGLGQGLEALVSSSREPAPTISNFARPAETPAPARWEVAVLRRQRKRLCRVTFAPSELLQKPKRRKVKTTSILALGALGAAGWELTAMRGNRFYLKRPVTAGD
ncbi:MAG: hypothetical protein ABI577_08025 [bacterium]